MVGKALADYVAEVTIIEINKIMKTMSIYYSDKWNQVSEEVLLELHNGLDLNSFPCHFDSWRSAIVDETQPKCNDLLIQ